jgi:tetratricopeptide (TPR) repeat protein
MDKRPGWLQDLIRMLRDLIRVEQDPIRMECYDEAQADLNRAIELNPEDASALATRGYTYWDMKRYDEALADFNRAIELAPDQVWVIASRGETYRAMGHRAGFVVVLALANVSGFRPVLARGWHDQLGRCIASSR